MAGTDPPERSAAPSPAPAAWPVRLRAMLSGRVFLTGCALVVVAILGVFAIRSSAVSDLRVGRISEESPGYPPNAMPYSLPRKSFVLATTTVVTGCVETPGGEEIRGRTELLVTATVEVDPSQQYYIYFDSGVRSKNLEYSVEVHDNGTLKAMSAAIRDQVAPLTAATVGGLVKVLAIPPAAIVAPAPPPAPPTQPVPNCRPLTAAITADPKDPRLAILQDDTWTPAYPDGLRYRVVPALDRLAARFDLRRPRWAHAAAEVALDEPAGSRVDAPDIAFSRTGCGPGEQTCDGAPALVHGLVLRSAVATRLRAFVCDAACDGLKPRPSEPAPPGPVLTPLPSRAEVVPQFGPLFLVRVHSGFAQDAAASVVLSPDGVITRLQLTGSNALGATVTSLGGSAADLTKAGREGPTTAALNKALAECLAAQKAVTAAGGTPVGTCQ